MAKGRKSTISQPEKAKSEAAGPLVVSRTNPRYFTVGGIRRPIHSDTRSTWTVKTLLMTEESFCCPNYYENR